MGSGSGQGSNPGRRTFLRWAAAGPAFATWPDRREGALGNREEQAPGPAEVEPPQGDVVHGHVGRLPSVRRQVRRYERSGDPGHLYGPELEAGLDGGLGAVDLLVRTVGERRVHEMDGPAERTIHGWGATDREVEALGQFGVVGFAGEVATTTVALRDVSPSDVRTVAKLPFVLSVGLDPPPAIEQPGPEPDGDGVPLADLRGEDYFRFSELPAEASIPSWLRIGIVDRGYGGAGDFERAHAADVGIDEDLARDFTGEGEWHNDDDHGSNVANTCAAMLPDGHEDLFVPLKVVPTGRTPSLSAVRDDVRAAIEYAEKRGIHVLNISLGTTGYRGTCPSTFCAELNGYVGAGFLPFAAVGNRDTRGVGFPGGEWYSIGVGGVDGHCPGWSGYERFVGEDGYYGSSYGTVRYQDSVRGTVHCPYCRHRSGQYAGFSPDVYGHYRAETDAGVPLWGTSYACPQVAAAGAVALANDPDGFGAVASLFRGMDHHGVCPEEAAREGELLDAMAAYRETLDATEE